MTIYKFEITGLLATGTKTIDCSHTGTTKLNRLEENPGAIAIALTPEDLRQINGASCKLQSKGYREALEKQRGL